MREVLWIALLSLVLAAGPAQAQTASAPPEPAAQVAQASPAPFPADARIAFVDLQSVWAQSAFGQQARTELQALQQKLNLDLQSRLEERDGLSQKIQTQQGIVSDAIVAGWVATLGRLEREAQFKQREAQIQVDELQGALLGEFEERVLPVIETIRAERNLLAVFSVPPAGDPGSGLRLVAVDRSLNLSAEVIKRLDAQ